MNETSSTYRAPWLVRFTDGTPPDDLGDGLHWFPVGPTGDGRVMWRRPAVAVAERHRCSDRTQAPTGGEPGPAASTDRTPPKIRPRTM